VTHGSTIYKESQGLNPRLVFPIVAFLIAVSAYLVIEQLIGGNPVGDNPASDEGLVLIVLFTGLLLPAFLLTLKLRTVVDQESIHLNVFPLKRSTIPVDDIAGFWIKSYDWLRDYGGFGIRVNSEGWAYIMQGGRGVQIQRRDGTRVLIGSADSEGFIQALRMATGLTESLERGRE